MDRSNAVLVEAGDGTALLGGRSDVRTLCDSYVSLNRKRVDLDVRLTKVPHTDQESEALWEGVEELLLQMTTTVHRLATVRSRDPADLRAKASVLSMILNTSAELDTECRSEVLALALAVADEVVALG